MGIARNVDRYLILIYQCTTDCCQIESAEEYLDKEETERQVEEYINRGIRESRIRIFKAVECSIKIKEATIHDPR